MLLDKVQALILISHKQVDDRWLKEQNLRQFYLFGEIGVDKYLFRSYGIEFRGCGALKLCTSRYSQVIRLDLFQYNEFKDYPVVNNQICVLKPI